MECEYQEYFCGDQSQNESIFNVDETNISIDENARLRDETTLLKDKVAHLQSQLEETENKAIIAAELGQRLLEERASLEAMREDDRNMYTAKIEELTQENFNLCGKLESKERLLAVHSQENDDIRKNKHEQEKIELKQLCERKMNELKNDLKKEKITADEEISQLNLKAQQKCEIIENLHGTIAELKAKLKNAESRSSGVSEIEELKTALEVCFESKCEAEVRLSEFIHDNERKSLEIGNFRERTKEMNEQLEYKKKQYEDCSQHLEEAKDTITELRIEISQLEMELKSSGHAKKGNSLFGELEDKRVAAERNLAIFKVRYESLQKAYTIAKSEILKMKNQVLCFLQTRSDRADRMRIEHLENALATKKAECNMLVAKLKKMENKEVESDPVKRAREYMKSFQGNETTKDYVKLLLVNTEEFKQKIATLQKELESVRFALIGKTDQLQETQRKLYTATNTSERNRNESLRAKLKFDELKNKFEAEKRKKTELEALLKKLESGNVDRTSPAEQGTEEKVKKGRKVIPPKDLQDAKKEDRKRKAEKGNHESKSIETGGIGTMSESDFEPKRPTCELTDEEKKAKCYRVLMNTLPKELAEEYVKGYEQEEKTTETQKENHCGLRRRERIGNYRTKSRKVSFKDEVDHLGEDEEQQSPEKKDPGPGQVHANIQKETVFNIKNEKPESKVVNVEENKDEACHVQ